MDGWKVKWIVGWIIRLKLNRRVPRREGEVFLIKSNRISKNPEIRYTGTD